jgi:hypothetical protein
MEKRLKTISKTYYDDEILFKDELGLHLKMGVKRKNYGTELDYGLTYDQSYQIIFRSEQEDNLRDLLGFNIV